MKRGLLILSLLVSCFIFVSAGDCTEDQTIMRLKSDFNSHVSVWDMNVVDYPNEICYNDIFTLDYEGKNPHACDGYNKILTLYSLTNSHASSTSGNGYLENVCYGDLRCIYDNSTGNECSYGRKLVARMFDSYNSHVSNASYANYPLKICCGDSKIYWANMEGVRITSAQLGDTVQLIVTYAGEGLFEIKENDYFLNPDDSIDAVGNISGISSDLNAVGLWTIPEDEDELSTLDLEEFYFTFKGMESNYLKIFEKVNPDIDDDGIVNQNNDDADGDRILNGDDPDIDDDGIMEPPYDVVDPNGDIDGDARLNINDPDMDGDTILNGDDPDFNSDNVLYFPYDVVDPNGDIDGDSILNINDPDMDGDKILNGDDPDFNSDNVLYFPYDNVDPDEDLDGDSILNINDPDMDGDGILNGDDIDFDNDRASDNSYLDSDMDDEMRIVILNPKCGEYFDEGEEISVKVLAKDNDDLISGSVFIQEELITLFDNKGVVFNYTPSAPGNMQIVVETVNTRGEESRAISNIMILWKDGLNYVDAQYVAACIKNPKDFSNIDGNIVDFDASNTRALKIVNNVFDIIEPISGRLDWIWKFSPNNVVRSKNGTLNDESPYIFTLEFPNAGRKSVELKVEVND